MCNWKEEAVKINSLSGTIKYTDFPQGFSSFEYKFLDWIGSCAISAQKVASCELRPRLKKVISFWVRRSNFILKEKAAAAFRSRTTAVFRESLKGHLNQHKKRRNSFQLKRDRQKEKDKARFIVRLVQTSRVFFLTGFTDGWGWPTLKKLTSFEPLMVKWTDDSHPPWRSL